VATVTMKTEQQSVTFIHAMDTLTFTRGRVEHRLHDLEWTREVKIRGQGEQVTHSPDGVKVRVTL
jgi:hypothetical protein